MPNINYIRFKGQSIEISVSVFVFNESGVYVAYCPSLDLSGYDTTEEKAKEDFDFMLSDYLQWQIQNKTLHKDLTRHGWKMGVKTGKEPAMSDMLGHNSHLRHIVTFPYSKINKACAVAL